MEFFGRVLYGQTEMLRINMTIALLFAFISVFFSVFGLFEIMNNNSAGSILFSFGLGFLSIDLTISYLLGKK